MTPRLNPMTAAPDVMQGMLGLEKAVAESGLDKGLIDLVKTRASQINGCAYCIKMHTRDARANGESEERLYLLDAWREAPVYTERERAALAWTEALTLISQTHAPDSDYAALKAQFDDAEQVKLTLLVAAINAWNRIAIGFRAVSGRGASSCRPPMTASRPSTASGRVSFASPTGCWARSPRPRTSCRTPGCAGAAWTRPRSPMRRPSSRAPSRACASIT